VEVFARVVVVNIGSGAIMYMSVRCSTASPTATESSRSLMAKLSGKISTRACAFVRDEECGVAERFDAQHT
jgi:hypothetical protein